MGRLSFTSVFNRYKDIVEQTKPIQNGQPGMRATTQCKEIKVKDGKHS